MIVPILFLLTLSLCSVGAEGETVFEDEGKGQEGEGKLKEEEKQFENPIPPKDTPRRVWMLNNISSVEAFINDAPVSVIGFFKDLHSEDADVFNEVLHRVKNLPFAISSDVAVWEKYNITNNTISLFKKFDEGRADYELKDKEMEPSQVIQFLRHNEMRLVIEYNRMDASQIFGSGIPIHLLLLVSKKSSEYEPLLKQFQTVAPEFRGEVIFILVDTDVRENSGVSSYFSVKEAELPAVCLYHVVTEAVEVMKASDMGTESLRQFCNNFIEGKEKSTVKPPRPPSEEL
ncbi:endoplasmic reticulum resident protein 27 [Carcharodon carcharias]|uniref:endoplasmic reticulum resident protein 27 n=1 Tax=Carcharodon carcharias TaxID=13397 RepID=UPI001B7E9B1A|nr:endoplasmic reticulum resident protein 27 [Carcharodon carcharias]